MVPGSVFFDVWGLEVRSNNHLQIGFGEVEFDYFFDNRDRNSFGVFVALVVVRMG